MPPKDAASKQIERAVNEALLRGDIEEASRLAAGHPDPAQHLKLMEHINAGAPHAERLQQMQQEDAARDEGLHMFALAGRPCTLVNFNPRSERHGDEQQPAADLKCKVNVAGDTLDAFDFPLRTMFFCQRGSGNDLADQAHDAPNLRSSKLAGPFKLKNRYSGYEFRVHFGDDDEHVVLHDCQMNKLEVDPMEGGTCVITFRLQFHPDELSAGRLAMLVGSTCDVTLTPPEHGGELTEQDEEEAEHA